MTRHCTCSNPEISYFFICLPICHVPRPVPAAIPLVFHSSVLITCLLKTFGTIRWSERIWTHRWSWCFFLYILLPITFHREGSQSRWRKAKAKVSAKNNQEKAVTPSPSPSEGGSPWLGDRPGVLSGSPVPMQKARVTTRRAGTVAGTVGVAYHWGVVYKNDTLR